MENLKEACKRFNETKENYNKILRDNQALRKKCDEKLKEEMRKIIVKLDEINSCAQILLETFHHYGDMIKFPMDIYEDREDCLIFTFTRDEYYISLNNEENILFRSSLNIDDIPTSCYELLVLNKDLVVEKTATQIQVYFDNETNKMNESIQSENAYYDMLTRNLFPEDVKDE